jgi:hypothetical protein
VCGTGDMGSDTRHLGDVLSRAYKLGHVAFTDIVSCTLILARPHAQNVYVVRDTGVSYYLALATFVAPLCTWSSFLQPLTPALTTDPPDFSLRDGCWRPASIWPATISVPSLTTGLTFPHPRLRPGAIGSFCALHYLRP